MASGTLKVFPVKFCWPLFVRVSKTILLYLFLFTAFSVVVGSSLMKPSTCAQVFTVHSLYWYRMKVYFEILTNVAVTEEIPVVLVGLSMISAYVRLG